MQTKLKHAVKATLRRGLPLGLRKRAAIWLGRSAWRGRYYWSIELLRDLAERDPNAFHRFLWAHHLAYAETYEVGTRLARAELHPTRELLLEDLAACLDEQGLQGRIDSVLDVGCSLGYVLRRLESGVGAGARRLDGIDIDGYAIAQGAAYLAQTGSRVRLAEADMSTVRQVFGSEPYDVVLSAGVLMYLREDDAARVVAAMMERTRRLIVLTGLADPEVDNRELRGSRVRDRDGTFIHNLDAMVVAAGGTIVRRRWEGARQLDGNTIYFVFATPSEAYALQTAGSRQSAAESREPDGDV